MSKVKVCYVLDHFNFGGTQKVVYDIINQLDYTKFSVFIILLTHGKEFLEKKKLNPAIQIYEFNYRYEASYSIFKYIQIVFFKQLTRRKSKDILLKIRDIKPDVLHFQTSPRELVIGILAKSMIGCQLVFTDHSVRLPPDKYPVINTFLLAIVLRQLYTKFHLIAVSKEIGALMKKYHWNHPSKLFQVIENRIIPSDFQVKTHQEISPVTIVYVARMSAVKQHSYLLDTWKKVKSEDLQLKLVGNGELEKDIIEKIKEENIKNVILTGNVDDVKREILESDIAVFPSSMEGMPISLLEKMATGLPVVVNNIPQLTSFVMDGMNGYVYKNQNDFIDRIEILAKDLQLRSKLGVNARKTVEKEMSNQSLGEIQADFYSEIFDYG